MTEYDERFERIRKYSEEARRRPWIYRGWVCDDPNVDKVWFVGFLKKDVTDTCHIKLMILFKSGAVHQIHEKDIVGMQGDPEELMVLKADEYLKNGGEGVLPLSESEINAL